MSLHLYTTKWDVPEGETVIIDNRRYFAEYTLSKLNDEMNGLLKHTDGATYYKTGMLIDKFGIGFPAVGLSSGGMTVLNIYYNPDVLFSTIECGDNALVDIRCLTRGRVTDGPLLTADDVPDACDIIVNDVYDGTRYTSFKEFDKEVY